MVLMVEEGMVVHGLAGYFESVLYDDVRIYQPALTHAGNVHWFPIFFPSQTPPSSMPQRTSRWTFED